MNEVPSRIPRLLLGSISSGIGKSLLMTGLIVALRKQGLSVSCCVTGPALHQALIYTRLSRRYSHSIDCSVLEVDQIISTIHEAERGADIVLIDGHGGFYDGAGPGDEFGSDADIAALTRTPAVLVMNVPSYSNSIAATVRGFSDFTENKLIHGLIANRVQLGEEVGPILTNPVMESINACMTAYALPHYIAGIPEAHFPTHIPAILCGQRENVTALPREFFLDVASLVSNHIDAGALLAIAEMAPPLPFNAKDLETRPRACRIAVTDDICFNVAYQDNLAWLIHYGAEIVPFSPLADNQIPKDVGAVYITGAYLDAYGTELSRNDRIRDSLRDFALQGGVVYSEGAGTAYLCTSYQVDVGVSPFPGVGVIPAEAVRVSQPSGIVQATIVEDSILGVVGEEVRGFSTGEWALRGGDLGKQASLMHTLRMGVGHGLPFNEGLSTQAQSLSTFQFLHFGSNHGIAQALVEAAGVRASGMREK